MLNANQERFIQEYIKTKGDAQASYRAAYDCQGRTMQSISASASRLLKHPEIRDRAATVLKKAQQKTEATVEKIIQEYSRMAFGDIRRAVRWGHKIEIDDATGAKVVTSGVVLVNSDELDDETAAAIAEVSEGPSGLKVKFHDKKGALDALAKIKGLFVEPDRTPPVDPAAAARAQQLEQMMFALLSNLAQPALVIDQPKRLNGNGSGNGHASSGEEEPPEPQEWPK